MSSTATDNSLLRVEAARYALLRRLASAMRHELVKHLQPIGMVTEVMNRRLRAPSPDLGQVNDAAAKLNSLSRTAVNACVDVITWLAPDPAATVSTEEAVAEVMELLRSNLGFRGFTLRSEVGALPQQIGRASVRMLVPGCLLALSDSTPAPAQFTLHGEPDGEYLRIRIAVQRGDGPPPDPADSTYRKLSWSDIEALAAAEDVTLTRTESEVTLDFVNLDE
jgi:hypothetical protein